MASIRGAITIPGLFHFVRCSIPSTSSNVGVGSSLKKDLVHPCGYEGDARTH